MQQMTETTINPGVERRKNQANEWFPPPKPGMNRKQRRAHQKHQRQMMKKLRKLGLVE